MASSGLLSSGEAGYWSLDPGRVLTSGEDHKGGSGGGGEGKEGWGTWDKVAEFGDQCVPGWQVRAGMTGHCFCVPTCLWVLCPVSTRGTLRALPRQIGTCTRGLACDVRGHRTVGLGTGGTGALRSLCLMAWGRLGKSWVDQGQ